MEYNMISVLVANFEKIHSKFIGKKELKINSRSEDMEDIFQDKLLWLLENEFNHNSSTDEDEVKYINMRLRSKLPIMKNKNLSCVEFNSNFENLPEDSSFKNDEKYFDKLEVLLLTYNIPKDAKN